jgi:antirestriction protein ArdC
MKDSIYDTITQQIVEAIEEGADFYRMPWHCARADLTNPANIATKRSYRGVNTLMLWVIAETRGYRSGTWGTYRQWQQRGAQVRKGEKSAAIVFWKNLRSAENEAAAEADEDKPLFVARGYSVFNAEQVEGYVPEAVPVPSEEERIGRADAFFARIPAKVVQEGDMSCYMPQIDTVQMVPFPRFRSAKAFYSVLAHELTHWTGAGARLNRDLSSRFGSEGYAMEEMVAELGAAFISGHLGLPSVPRTDHAPYIASWLKVLKNDSRAIFTAASKAQAAADYLKGFSEDEPDV